MSKRDIIDLSSDDEDETPMKMQKTEEIIPVAQVVTPVTGEITPMAEIVTDIKPEIKTDIQVHNELTKRFGAEYFDRFRLDDEKETIELVKALVEFGYPTSFILDYIQNTYKEAYQPIYDQGDCTIGWLTLSDTPNYFYRYPVQEKPKLDLRKVHRERKPIFRSIQKIKSKKCTPIQYTGTVPISDSAREYIEGGYFVRTTPYKY